MFKNSLQELNKLHGAYSNQLLVHNEELDNIIKIMNNYSNYRVLIIGQAGSGKTTLLKMVSQYSPYKNPINIYFAHNFFDNEFGNINVLEKYPLLFDALDELKDPYQLLSFIDKNNVDRFICTTRTAKIPKELFKYFTHIIEIKPLTKEQINLLIGDKLKVREDIFNSAQQYLTPRDVLRYIIDHVDSENMLDFYGTYDNLSYQYKHGVDINTNIILPENQLVVPSNDIISSITIINESLVNKAKENPAIIHQLTPREFEEFVCELLEKEGYNVELTKQTRDGGKDLIVIQKSFLGDFCTYVECKKYDKNMPISVGLVRQLYGTIMADNITAGMLITTSYFSKDAIKYTNNLNHRIKLNDFNDIVKKLNNL